MLLSLSSDIDAFVTFCVLLSLSSLIASLSDACVTLFIRLSPLMHPSLSSDASVAVVLSVTPYRYSLPRGDTVLSVTSFRYFVSLLT